MIARICIFETLTVTIIFTLLRIARDDAKTVMAVLSCHIDRFFERQQLRHILFSENIQKEVNDDSWSRNSYSRCYLGSLSVIVIRINSRNEHEAGILSVCT